jgi:predicted RNA binding protein YcfA (HicA-like mRNA interferase family)
MTPRKQRLTAKEVIKILEANGFIRVDQHGSHIKFVNHATRKTTIVPNHRGELKIGTLNAIEKQAGITF